MLKEIYKIIGKKRREKKDLEGLRKAKGNPRSDFIEVRNWNNWEHSLWIKIKTYSGQVIIDSGVIEELAEEIKKLKLRRK